jgi:hypothetical protein
LKPFGCATFEEIKKSPSSNNTYTIVRQEIY